MRKIKVEQYTVENELIATYNSVAEARAVTGIHNITRSIDHPTLLEGGYRWKRSVVQNERNYHYGTGTATYSEDQRKQLNDRIPQYMPILHNLCHALPFVQPWNKDDYMQEALMWVWLNYHYYEPAPGDDTKFAKWFKVVARSGMYQYYYSFVRGWYVREFFHESHDVPEDDLETLDDTNARIVALYKSLDSLPPIDREVAILYMNSVPGAEAANRVGISTNVYFKKVQHLKFVLKERIEFYLFGLNNSRRPLEDKRHCKGKDKRVPVEQYDLMGKYVATFSSINDTQAAGFVPGEVSKCTKGRQKSHRGFMWKVAPAVV